MADPGKGGRLPARPGPILRLIEWVQGWSLAMRLGGGLAGVLVVGMADFLAGPDMALSIFYLLPVCMVAWHVGRPAGAGLALMSAGLAWGADLYWSASYTSSFIPWWNAGVRLTIFIVMALIVGALRLALEREKVLSGTDPLTGMMNRRAFYDRGTRAVQRARRYGHVLSFIYIDLDHFKEVNDRRGHREGDLLLRALGETFSRNVRTTDLCARIGGDEFALLLPETDHASARILMERLVEVIEATMQRNRWDVTLSAGVVTFRGPPADLDQVVHEADRVMYRAKDRDETSVEYEVLGEPPEGGTEGGGDDGQSR